jgi:hypothetical protein
MSARLDHRKVRFSAFSRAVRPLLKVLLRRILNVSPFGRWGVRNVSPARIFGILRNSTVFVSSTLESGLERNSAVSATPEVKMESTCWQLRHRPFQSLNSHHWVIDCAVKILEIYCSPRTRINGSSDLSFSACYIFYFFIFFYSTPSTKPLHDSAYGTC